MPEIYGWLRVSLPCRSDVFPERETEGRMDFILYEDRTGRIAIRPLGRLPTDGHGYIVTQQDGSKKAEDSFHGI